MSWTGHFHGYGPWIGSPDQYHREGDRRPVHPDPPAPPVSDDDKVAVRVQQRYREVAAEFATSELPPMMSGHWLMKRGRTSAERTWDDSAVVLDWLTRQFLDHPPMEREDGRQAYVDLDTKRAYVLDVLPVGVDVSWVYYNRSGGIVSLNVVCCPNRHHPGLTCPLG
ncbi:hypothetical protein NGF19_24995 [Streptomyces sp. RY43-2]|uniref:Uncharacterized protein n=1 Tax=Streptomyces macrolidinus TaxID=2952607 RepID=A0ABT0ZK82_9ACTN|nr:hypothetical protein [Streptomyces macrolidinus]MCN9244000.1 hypothetical protein [Streptomyces macrolidinus]